MYKYTNYLNFNKIRFIYFVLLITIISCEKKLINPEEQFPKGSIEAMVGNKKWPDTGKVFQVFIQKHTNQTIEKYPCLRDNFSIVIISYTNLQVVTCQRLGSQFNVPSKIGIYQLNYIDEFEKNICTNIPNSRGFSYEECDATASRYSMDKNRESYLNITKISTDNVEGNFDIWVTKTAGFGLPEFPDSLHVVCTKFVAER